MDTKKGHAEKPLLIKIEVHINKKRYKLRGESRFTYFNYENENFENINENFFNYYVWFRYCQLN